MKKGKKLILILIVIVLIIILFQKKLYNIYKIADNSTKSINNKLVEPKSKLSLKNRSIIQRIKYLKEVDDIITEKEKIYEENQQLLSKIEELKMIKQENELLKQKLELKKESGSEFETAKVILIDSTVNIDSIYINKGKDYNLKVGMPVLDKNILIGFISYVDDNFSEINLLTNRETRVSVIINDKMYAILRGNGNNTFSINRYHEEIDDIKYERFDIKTSGISEKYPKGLKIGEFKVSSVNAYETLHTLEFRPNYKVDDMNIVFIYKKNIDENIVNKIIERENTK